MTSHNAPTTPRKPPSPKAPSRWWLIGPWSAAIVLAIGWSIAWAWAAHETGRRLDQAAADLRAGGWQTAWANRRVYGYPFRLDVDVGGLKLADPSGWAIAVPTVKAEAYLFAPTRWVIAIPNGLTFTRPQGGAVDVGARRLRFSLNSWDEHPPKLSLEGEDLTFTPEPGAKPFSLARSSDLQLYTRAGPDDQGALLLSVKDGVSTPGSWLASVAPGKTVAITLEATFTHASQMQGHGVREAALRWAHSGGGIDVQQFTAQSPSAGFDARHGRVSVSDHGLLNGQIEGTFHGLREVPPIYTLFQDEGGTAEVVIYSLDPNLRRPKTRAEAKGWAARFLATEGLTIKATGIGKAPVTLPLYPGPDLF